MKSFVHGGATLGLALLLTACGSTPPTAQRPPVPAESRLFALDERSDLLPNAAEEARIEAHARFASGLIADLDQETATALDHFYRSALADPAHEELVMDVSRRLLQQRETDKALALLVKSTALPEASGVQFAFLGVALAQQGKTNQAIAANRTAIKRSPQSLPAYQNLSQLYLQTGQPKEALRILDEAARQPDLEAGFLVDLAEVFTGYSTTRKLDPATVKPRVIAALNRAADLKPEEPALLEKLADGFKLLGETTRASEIYLQLLADDPEAMNLRVKLAEIYLRTNDPNKAAEQWEVILRNNPTNPTAYFFLGTIALEQRKPAKAAEYFEKAVLFNPGHEQLYFELALAQLNSNKPDAALATLAKARDRFPQSFGLEFYTALAQSRAKRFSEAIKAFTTAEVLAQTTDPKLLNHLFYFQLGSVYERSDNREQAERYFKKALELSPDFSEALNYLGYMWAERGEHLAEAEAMIEKAVKLEPQNAAFLDSLGWVLYKLGRPQDGLRYLQQAVEHSEEPDATLLDHLGDIYAALHQPDAAREAWRKSLALEANDAIQKKLQNAGGTAPTP